MAHHFTKNMYTENIYNILYNILYNIYNYVYVCACVGNITE